MRFILLLLPFFVFFTNKTQVNTAHSQDLPQYQKVAKDLKKPFDLYPNPVANQFTLKSGYFSQSDTKLYIFDVSGRMVIKLDRILFDEENTSIVDISHLSSGLYFVQLRTGNYSATKKIFKS